MQSQEKMIGEFKVDYVPFSNYVRPIDSVKTPAKTDFRRAEVYLEIPLSMEIDKRGKPRTWSIVAQGAYAKMQHKLYEEELFPTELLNAQIGVKHFRSISDSWSLLVMGTVGLYTDMEVINSHANVGPGQRVGIVGIGGLGHMAVKIAKAMGAEVVVITTSLSKVEDAKRLGADDVILSTDKEQMKANAHTLHFILDCVSAQHDINAYINLLKRDGKLTLVGAPEHPLPVSAFSLILNRISFSGSLIGGIAQTQEMLDFCGKHNITSDIEMIQMQDINQAYERLLKGDVKYRFVIDMASLKN